VSGDDEATREGTGGPGGSRVFSFAEAPLVAQVAHAGAGSVLAARVVDRPAGEPLRFLDLVEVPVGATVGRHRHSTGDEELYVIVSGTGEVELDGAVLACGPGDVILNRPGGTHALRVTGPETLRMVVIDVEHRLP
jgi:quercetin dioxygenase-like cupin family protein